MKWIYVLYLCFNTLSSNLHNSDKNPYLTQTRRPFRLQRVSTSQHINILDTNYNTPLQSNYNEKNMTIPVMSCKIVMKK